MESSPTFEVNNMGTHAKLAEQCCSLGGAHPLDCALNLPAYIEAKSSCGFLCVLTSF